MDLKTVLKSEHLCPFMRSAPWLGNEMVFSDRPNGIGPAMSTLGVLGRESFAGWSPKRGHVKRAEPKCQLRDRLRVGGRC